MTVVQYLCSLMRHPVMRGQDDPRMRAPSTSSTSNDEKRPIKSDQEVSKAVAAAKLAKQRYDAHNDECSRVRAEVFHHTSNANYHVTHILPRSFFIH
jgi:hypothetical protein